MKNLIILSLLLAASESLPQKKATLVIVNAKVITLDDNRPQAQAIAMVGDKIAAVGNDAEILQWKSKKTQLIDARGKTVIPGLYDSHLHVIRGGRFYNAELRWDGVKTLKRALEMLAEQAQRTPQGQWVRVVGGWTEYQFDEKRGPTLDEINKATGKTPAFVLKLYGEAYLNKAGLQQLSIDENTPNPVGGLIQKDRFGQPTGLLVAEPNAFILYATLAKLPELSDAEKVNSTRMFMTELNSLGITSVMDAGGGFQNFPDDYAITDRLSKANQLTVRLPYYLFAQKPGKELEDYQKWIDMVDIDATHDHGAYEYHVQGGGENLVASGGDFENFTKPRPELPAKMEQELKAVIAVLVKNRWPFRLHATYDESIGRFLDVIEQVNEMHPIAGLPWLFDHAETVSDQNLRRIKALGGGISIQHRMAYQAENFIARYGKKAAQDTPPIKKMLDMGVKVGAGTDGTRVASYNPWVGLYWLVTGQSVGGTAFAALQNRLDRITALRLFTVGSASLIHQNDRGRIQPGMLADLAILNSDYLSVDSEKIKDIRAELTIVGGQPVYGTGDFAPYAPPAEKAIPSWSPVNFYGGYQYR